MMKHSKGTYVEMTDEEVSALEAYRQRRAEKEAERAAKAPTTIGQLQSALIAKGVITEQDVAANKG